MISSHCGQRLKSTLAHSVGYVLGYHAWKCVVCERIFIQRIRRGK